MDPGAKLTTADAAQKAGLDRQVCRVLLQNLVEAGFLEQRLPGVFVSASDYLKVLPDSIDRWLPKPLQALGTDGFGRSDSRATDSVTPSSFCDERVTFPLSTVAARL